MKNSFTNIANVFEAASALIQKFVNLYFKQ